MSVLGWKDPRRATVLANDDEGLDGSGGQKHHFPVIDICRTEL